MTHPRDIPNPPKVVFVDEPVRDGQKPCRQCGVNRSQVVVLIGGEQVDCCFSCGKQALEAQRGYARQGVPVRPCPCECNHGSFCGGCGHAGCGGRQAKGV